MRSPGADSTAKSRPDVSPRDAVRAAAASGVFVVIEDSTALKCARKVSVALEPNRPLRVLLENTLKKPSVNIDPDTVGANFGLYRLTEIMGEGSMGSAGDPLSLEKYDPKSDKPQHMDKPSIGKSGTLRITRRKLRATLTSNDATPANNANNAAEAARVVARAVQHAQPLNLDLTAAQQHVRPRDTLVLRRNRVTVTVQTATSATLAASKVVRARASSSLPDSTSMLQSTPSKYSPRSSLTDSAEAWVKVIVAIEQHADLHTARTVSHRFADDESIADVINVVAGKGAVRLTPQQTDCAALYMMQRGRTICLDRTRTLSYYGISASTSIEEDGHFDLSLRLRPEESLTVTVFIANHEELQCARKVTCVFSSDLTAREASLKLARKGNVSIPDDEIFHFDLCVLAPRRKRMRGRKTLREYDVADGDRLVLVRKKSLLARLWSSNNPEDVDDPADDSTRVVVLFEQRTNDETNEYLFKGKEEAVLYQELLHLDHDTEHHDDGIRSVAAGPKSRPKTPSDGVPLSALLEHGDRILEERDHESGNFIGNENEIASSCGPDSEQQKSPKFSRSQPSPPLPRSNSPRRGQQRRGELQPRRKGALPRRTKASRNHDAQQLRSQASLNSFGSHGSGRSGDRATTSLLVTIHFSEKQFWALAVNSRATVKDVAGALRSQIESAHAVLLHCHLVPLGDRTDDPTTDNGACEPGWGYKEVRVLQDDERVVLLRNLWSEEQPDNIVSRFVLRPAERPVAFEEPTTTTTLDEIQRRAEGSARAIPDEVTNTVALAGMLGEQHESNRETRKREKVQTSSVLFIGGTGGSHTASLHDDVKWLDAREVTRGSQLSEGAFAKVFKGTYRGDEVAIKVLQGSLEPEQVYSFRVELQILNSVQSPHLVEFIGAYISPAKNQLSMVMEFCPNGSVYDYLNSPKRLEFDWVIAVRWFRQLLLGVEVLHEQDPPLVHRDIKSLNLLLDTDLNAKVCDFGLSRMRTVGNAESLAEVRGTMAFCPPEIFDGSLFDFKSDVYSCAIVLYELAMRASTGKYHKPFKEFKEIESQFQILVKAHEGIRPTLPKDIPQDLRALAELMWHQDPGQRPTCTAALQLLDATDLGRAAVKHQAASRQLKEEGEEGEEGKEHEEEHEEEEEEQH